MVDFHQILQVTLTPVALISGVGLLLLSMVNRYNHALDRTRLLLKDKQIAQDSERIKIDQAIQVLYARCKIMKNAILCVTSSIFFSGFIVLITALEGFIGIILSNLKGLLLLCSVGLVVVGAVFFIVDIFYSLHAIRIDIET
jgi:hypothetical protein